MNSVFKKIVAALALGTLLSASLSAQEQEKETHFVPRLSIAGYPGLATDYFRSSSSYDYEKPLAYVYSDYYGTIYTSGNITASLDVILSRRIAVTMDLGVTFMWKDAYDSISDERNGRKTGAAISFIPQFKFYYLVRPVVRLYGDAGIGITKYVGCDRLTYYSSGELTDHSVRFAGQFVPFGMEIGKTFFGFAELGMGTAYTGVRAGVGYKF